MGRYETEWKNSWFPGTAIGYTESYIKDGETGERVGEVVTNGGTPEEIGEKISEGDWTPYEKSND